MTPTIEVHVHEQAAETLGRAARYLTSIAPSFDKVNGQVFGSEMEAIVILEAVRQIVLLGKREEIDPPRHRVQRWLFVDSWAVMRWTRGFWRKLDFFRGRNAEREARQETARLNWQYNESRRTHEKLTGKDDYSE